MSERFTKSSRRAIGALAAVVATCALASASASAALLTPSQTYIDPTLVPFAMYPQDTLSNLSGSSSLVYGNVTSAQILPPLLDHNYTPGYSFSQSDYYLNNGPNYTADLTAGTLTLNFSTAGLYHVRITHADNSVETRAIFAEASAMDVDSTLGSGAAVRVDPPKADLVLIAEGDAAVDSAAAACTKSDPNSAKRTTSKQDAIDKIKAASQAAGKKIHVELVGHGAPGKISLNDKSLAAGNLIDNASAADFQKAIDPYVDHISFYSCQTAKGDEGSTFLTTFASSIGSASGFTTSIYIATGKGLDIASPDSDGYFMADLSNYREVFAVPEPAPAVLLGAGALLACASRPRRAA